MKNLLEIEDRQKALKVLDELPFQALPQLDFLIKQINEHSQPGELALALGFFKHMQAPENEMDPALLFGVYSKIIQAAKPFKMAATLYILKTLFRPYIPFCINPNDRLAHSVLFFTDAEHRLCYEIEGRVHSTPWVLDNALEMSYLESHREEIIRHITLDKNISTQGQQWIEHPLTQNVSEHPMGFFWALVLSKLNHLNLFESPTYLSQLLDALKHLYRQSHYSDEIFKVWMEMQRDMISFSLLDGLIAPFSSDGDGLIEVCRHIKTVLGIDEHLKNPDCLQGRYFNVRIQKEELERISGQFRLEFLSKCDVDNYFDDSPRPYK